MKKNIIIFILIYLILLSTPVIILNNKGTNILSIIPSQHIKNISINNKKSINQKENKKINKEKTQLKELSSIISKAKTDRVIEDSIDNKVNAEFNSMLYQIKKLNSRYGEKNRSYATIKDEVITLLKKNEKK